MKSPEYVKAGESKSRIEKLLQNLTGTTEQNYHSKMKTPNVYEKSYLDNKYDEPPMPSIPTHIKIVDNPDS